jgi:hypothetical protein
MPPRQARWKWRPQALGKIDSGDGNGAIRGRADVGRRDHVDRSDKGTKGQVSAPNALKSQDRGQGCTTPGRKEAAGLERAPKHNAPLTPILGERREIWTN